MRSTCIMWGYHDLRVGYHEYTGGIISALEGSHDTCGVSHENVGGCSVYQRDIMSTLGTYHNLCGRAHS